MRQWIVTSLIAINLIGCVQLVAFGVEAKRDPIQPIRPDCNAIDRSAAIVKSIVGDDFFSRYLQFWSLQLTDTRGANVTTWREGGDGRTAYEALPEVYYEVQWAVRFPFGDAPRSAVFNMDQDGKLLTNRDEIQLPPCVEHPEMCQFSVTPEEAKSIALKATTPGRAMPELLWSGLYHRYVWRVEVQPEGVQWIGKCEGCKMAIIDPNTRQVLMAGDWKEGWQ